MLITKNDIGYRIKVCTKFMSCKTFVIKNKDKTWNNYNKNNIDSCFLCYSANNKD